MDTDKLKKYEDKYKNDKPILEFNKIKRSKLIQIND